MKPFIVGSMLSPFCIHNSEYKFWIMILGMQFIYDREKKIIKFNIIKFRQYTHSIRNTLSKYYGNN